MSRARTFIINTVIRSTSKANLSRLKFTEKNLATMTRRMENLAGRSALAKKIDIEKIECNGVRAELQKRRENSHDEAVILYFHGGGYVAGSTKSHRDLTARIVLKSGIPLLSVDYRLAPEHTYPAQIEDALASYRWLLEKDWTPEKIIIGGDSAGGNLALALMHAIEENKLPRPGAGFFLSPFTDMRATGDSVKTNRRRDPMLPAHRITELAEIYAPGYDHTSPLISPLYGDFSTFPPVYFTAGSTEVLLDDTLRIVKKCENAGVDVTCRIRKNMPHVYPSLAAFFPEGREAIREISDFLKTKLSG